MYRSFRYKEIKVIEVEAPDSLMDFQAGVMAEFRLLSSIELMRTQAFTALS